LESNVQRWQCEFFDFFFRFTYSCDAAAWQWKIMAIKKLNVSQEQRRNNLEREVQRLCVRLLDFPSPSFLLSSFPLSWKHSYFLSCKRPLFFHFSPPAISTLTLLASRELELLVSSVFASLILPDSEFWSPSTARTSGALTKSTAPK